jgi:hypothetical protein
MDDEGRSDAVALDGTSNDRSRLLDVPFRALEQAFQTHAERPLNRSMSNELAQAINWWLEDAHPGTYLRGFRAGLRTWRRGPNERLRVVCIAAK